MRHYLFGALSALFILSESAFAQYPTGVHSHFGGDFPRSGFYSPNYLTINYEGMTGRGIPGLGVAGLGGDFANPYFPSYYYAPAQDVFQPPFQPLRLQFPAHTVQLSGESPATLSLEFPAPAAVWLNEKELPGKRERTRTLTSPVLRPGEKYTFHIRASWEVNGKKFEYRRETEVGSGDLIKLLVVSGSQ